jgi:hypothetical protein
MSRTEEELLNTRAAGSGLSAPMRIPPSSFVANPDENVLDDMRETVKPFILEKRREGKTPYRLVYMFGGANVTGFRNGKKSDLGLLLQLLVNKQREDTSNLMTYVYAFDSSYNEDNVRRDIQEINRAFGSPAEREIHRQAFRDDYISEINKFERYHGGAEAVEVKHMPFPTETFFPARYSFGQNCFIFFFDSNLKSYCLSDIPIQFDKQKAIRDMGFQATSLTCMPQETSAFSYLQSLAQELLNPGELYLYNCAWEDTNEPYLNASGRVVGSRWLSGNQYFETFPEVLFLAAYDYSPNRIIRTILYNHFSNLFLGEEIVVDSGEHLGRLRQVVVDSETDFVPRRREGGKRKTLRDSKNQKRKVKNAGRKTTRTKKRNATHKR